MARSGVSIMDRLLHRRHLFRWTRAARRAAQSDLVTLRDQRVLARQLRQQLDRLLHVADSRLALPRGEELDLHRIEVLVYAG